MITTKSSRVFMRVTARGDLLAVLDDLDEVLELLRDSREELIRVYRSIGNDVQANDIAASRFSREAK